MKRVEFSARFCGVKRKCVKIPKLGEEKLCPTVLRLKNQTAGTAINAYVTAP